MNQREINYKKKLKENNGNYLERLETHRNIKKGNK